MNQKDTAKLVYMALAAFPHLQSKDVRWKETVRIWSLVIEDECPYPLAEQALVSILKTAKFFPTPAEVREKAIQLKWAAESQRQSLEESVAREIESAWYQENQAAIKASEEQNKREISKVISAWKTKRREAAQ